MRAISPGLTGAGILTMPARRFALRRGSVGQLDVVGLPAAGDVVGESRLARVVVADRDQRPRGAAALAPSRSQHRPLPRTALDRRGDDHDGNITPRWIDYLVAAIRADQPRARLAVGRDHADL